MSIISSVSQSPSLRPRGMYKRLIVACDGTWLNSDNGMLNGEIAVPSNVTRITRAINPVSADGITQIVNYQFGVGSRGNRVSRAIEGTTGEGIQDNIREGYSFICNNYVPGDEIILLGFSRGAFTARSIAGLISTIGVLTKDGIRSLVEIFRDVRHRRNPDYKPRNPDVPFPDKPSAQDPYYVDELERRGLTVLGVTVKAIGVWDTVGALGAPRIGILTRVGLQSMESDEMQFYDTKLSNWIENAFQALSLDERRGAFAPALWEKPPNNQTVLRQVWFPGVHSNVGGGYDDQEIANITLAWMMSQLEPFVDMRMDYIFEQVDENAAFYAQKRRRERPWSFGRIYDSNSGVYALSSGKPRTPGCYNAMDPFNNTSTTRPLANTNEYIHPSVRTRFKLGGPGVDDKDRYLPEALADWRLVVEHSGPGGEPNIFWRARFADQNVSTRILPESPMWRIERELCKMDPDTYDYLRNPPETMPPAMEAAMNGGGGGPGHGRSRSLGAIGGGGPGPRPGDRRKLALRDGRDSDYGDGPRERSQSRPRERERERERSQSRPREREKGSSDKKKDKATYMGFE